MHCCTAHALPSQSFHTDSRRHTYAYDEYVIIRYTVKTTAGIPDNTTDTWRVRSCPVTVSKHELEVDFVVLNIGDGRYS